MNWKLNFWPYILIVFICEATTINEADAQFEKEKGPLKKFPMVSCVPLKDGKAMMAGIAEAFNAKQLDYHNNQATIKKLNYQIYGLQNPHVLEPALEFFI